jgi:hypothetical protein
LARRRPFSVGEQERQKEALHEIVNRGARSWVGTEPADIREEMTAGDERRIPLDKAIFDLSTYPQASIIEDPETGEKWGTDLAEYNRLQDEALDAKATELRKTWPWVEIVHGHFGSEFDIWSVEEGDPKAGALIAVNSHTGKVEIYAPALRREPRQDFDGAASTGSASEGKQAAPPRPPLSQKQLEQLHATKTRALRRAIAERRTHDGRVPIALACLGMLGAREIRGLAPQQEHIAGYGDRVHSVDSALAETAALDQLLKTASLDLPKNFKAHGRFDAAFSRNSKAAAAWFGALMALPGDDLYELHARLVAERFGSWLAMDKDTGHHGDLSRYLPRLGDSPLAIAIAQYTGAEPHLADLWQPDREWFEQYGKDRLFAIAHSQCHIRNANQLKKGQLVDVVMEQPKGFWTASLFPEAAFQSEADAEKALDLTRTQLPLPEPTRTAAE